MAYGTEPINFAVPWIKHRVNSHDETHSWRRSEDPMSNLHRDACSIVWNYSEMK